MIEYKVDRGNCAGGQETGLRLCLEGFVFSQRTLLYRHHGVCVCVYIYTCTH